MTIKWKVTLTKSYVPMPPEQRYAYDAAIRELVAMAMPPCQHLHVMCWTEPILTDEGWDEGPVIETCADCGKHLNPVMIAPVDIEQLADSES
jgi:hypothetical protein